MNRPPSQHVDRSGTQTPGPAGWDDVRVNDGWAGVGRLLVGIAMILLVWLVVLPWWSRRTSTQTYLQRLRDRGIDPGAMYYTELPPELFLDR